MKAAQTPPVSSTPTVPMVQPSEGGLDLGQVFATLRRKALLIAGVTIAVSSAAGAAALLSPPRYATGFEILIEPNNAESAVIASVPGSLTGQTDQPGTVNTDLIKVLSSPRLVRPALQKLEAENPGACSALVSASAGRPVKFRTFDEDALNSCYGVVAPNLTFTIGGRDAKATATTGASTILGVTFQSQEPKAAEAFTRLLAQAYLDYSLESRQADVRRGIDFVNKKLPDLQGRVEDLQGQLQQLRQDYNLIDPNTRGAQLSGQVGSFTQQLLDNQLQLEQLRAISGDLQAQLAQQPSEMAASSALNQNPRFQSLLNRILELDSQIAAASTLYLGTSPDMQVLQDQRQNLVTLLAKEGEQAQREVLNQIQNLETRDQALRQTLSELDAGVNDLSAISRAYVDIQRDLDVSTQTYTQFLAKREALQIDAAQQEVPWEILTPPSSPSPSATSVMQNLILGALLGLLLGAGAALAVDRLTDVLYSPEELKRITRLPLLGAIPLNRNIEEYRTQRVRPGTTQSGTSAETATVRPDGYRSDPFFEAFRSLFANIRLLNTDSPVRSLVISSTIPEEGKSITSTYLAQAAAAMGRRVLLVDTDLRRPQLHQYMNLENVRGLTDIISDVRELYDVIQQSPQEPNLWVLPSGSIPPDPTRFLSSQKMQHLMEQIQDQFDLVIYDTPPLSFADAFLTAAHTDGLVLVAELGRLKRSLLEQSLEQANISNTPILGIVVQKAMGT
ncbi:polysaccharide biosynthesis tyrosine autokinase [Phormidium tenue FACHB-886]|nr:polysaccharide biosynthesis tyrosine autokinase [Phormidium tenue FACHB-886]